MPAATGPFKTDMSDPEEAEIVAFLGDPASYRPCPSQVTVIETHCARVFLAGAEAYKVKKRVRMPFLDFSTLDRRHQAIAREFEINRPYAPQIYIDLVPITRASNDRLVLGGSGSPVEWALRMRRFDQEALLANVAAQGPLPDALSKEIARLVIDYHRNAAVAYTVDGAEDIGVVVRQLTMAFGERADIIGAETSRRLIDQFNTTHETVASLLSERSRQGCLRRCHGDLHLGNIVLIDSAPVPFDALEFSEELATIDVFYDLAFLLMDLDARGDRHAANVVLNTYANAAPVGGEIEGLASLPLFLACRAGVRAVVTMERVAQLHVRDRDVQEESVCRLCELALHYLQRSPGALVAVGGLSGTGKSTLAAAIASDVGPAPGALHIRSDVERKRLFGVAETEPLEPEHYRPEVSERVYAVLIDKARRALVAGHGVIVDAVYAKPEERAAIEQVAHQMGRPFVGLWLTAPAATLVARVEARRGDASDADRTVVGKQLTYDIGSLAWAQVDASGTPAQCRSNALEALTARGLKLEG